MADMSNYTLSDFRYLDSFPAPYPPSEALAAATAALGDDGDIFELADGRSLRLRIEVDQDTEINDSDCYGKVEWIQRGHHRDPRPEGFDGRARKLWGASDPFWWQPWEGATDAEIAEFVPRIQELAEYGFKLVGLELRETLLDSRKFEHTIVVDVAWIGGVDAFYPELIGELVAELRAQVEEEVAA
jgi:hypothetical protein